MLALSRQVLCIAVVSAGLAVGLGVVRAQDAQVVTVGKAGFTLPELQRQLSEVPSFQLATLGKSPQQIRQQFVERVVVPKLLYEQAAIARKLDTEPHVQRRSQALLAESLQEQLRQRVDAEIGPAEVKAYFEANRSQLERPERIRLSRLLVAKRAEAETLLQKAQRITDMAEWRQLVREHSLDKATHLRGGDLGFVHPDGTTEVPRVRASAATYQAASKVKDGELVSEPIEEGKHFAILWRRGTLAAQSADLEQEAPRIRQLLREAKLQQELTALTQRLSKDRVKRHAVELLEQLELELPADPRALPETLIAPVATSARPGVEPAPAGLR